MTKHQLRVIANLFRYHKGKVSIKRFDRFGGGKLVDLPRFRNRHPKVFISYCTPVDRLEEWYCDSVNMVIGPEGGIYKREIHRMVNLPYNYRPND